MAGRSLLVTLALTVVAATAVPAAPAAAGQGVRAYLATEEATSGGNLVRLTVDAEDRVVGRAVVRRAGRYAFRATDVLGQRVAVVRSEDGGTPSVVVVDRTGRHLSTPLAGGQDAQLHPDGRRILGITAEGTRLVVAGLGGSGARVLARAAGGRAWSGLALAPDGRYAYLLDLQRDGSPGADRILRVTVATGGVAEIRVGGGPCGACTDLDVSPDGRYLAVARLTGLPEAQVLVVPAHGGAPRTYQPGSAYLAELVYEPDGRSLVATVLEGDAALRAVRLDLRAGTARDVSGSETHASYVPLP